MSELFDKQVNEQKEKNFWGSRKLPQTHKKGCDENERNKETNKKKRHTWLLMEGSIIGRIRKTGENNLLRVNNSGHNEGTICLNWCQGDGFSSMGA